LGKKKKKKNTEKKKSITGVSHTIFLGILGGVGGGISGRKTGIHDDRRWRKSTLNKLMPPLRR